MRSITRLVHHTVYLMLWQCICEYVGLCNGFCLGRENIIDRQTYVHVVIFLFDHILSSIQRERERLSSVWHILSLYTACNFFFSFTFVHFYKHENASQFVSPTFGIWNSSFFYFFHHLYLLLLLWYIYVVLIVFGLLIYCCMNVDI